MLSPSLLADDINIITRACLASESDLARQEACLASESDLARQEAWKKSAHPKPDLGPQKPEQKVEPPLGL